MKFLKPKKRKLDKENYANIIGRKREQHKLYFHNIKGSPKHKIKIEKSRNMKNSCNRNDGFMERINAFKTQIKEGSYYIGIVYNKYLYRKSVSRIRFHSYKDLNENILFCVDAHDGEFYICLTCDRKLKKTNIPCQKVANKLAVERLLISDYSKT